MNYSKMEDESGSQGAITPTTPAAPVTMETAVNMQQQKPGQGQPMILMEVPMAPKRITESKAKVLRAMGVTQIVLGCLCVLFNVGACVAFAAVTMFVAPGIWVGIPVIIAGAFGVTAGRRKTTCHVVTCLVMSIISAVFTVSIVSTTGIGLATEGSYYYFAYYTPVGLRYTFNALLLLVGLTEFIVAIVTSALCCGAICNDSPSAPSNYMVVNPGQVQYMACPTRAPVPNMGMMPQGAIQPAAAPMMVPQGQYAPQMQVPMRPPSYGTTITYPSGQHVNIRT